MQYVVNGAARRRKRSMRRTGQARSRATRQNLPQEPVRVGSSNYLEPLAYRKSSQRERNCMGFYASVQPLKSNGTTEGTARASTCDSTAKLRLNWTRRSTQ